MTKIIITGETSYLAQGIKDSFVQDDVTVLFMPELEKNADLIRSADVVINFCLHPEFSSRNFTIDEIIDTDIAKCIQGTPVRYFFLSSRKVYGSSQDVMIYKEEAPLAATDFYSRNKIKEEAHLKSILGDQLTIVRIANVIGDPILRKGYKTFIGWITSEMAQKHHLTATENPATVKDYITRSYLQSALHALVHADARGVYNIGSGFGTSLFELLTEMVGPQNVDFDSSKAPKDQFILDCQKLHRHVLPMTKPMLISQCRKNQRILRAAYEQKELIYA